MKKVTTLSIIEDGDKVLLAMKKRGHGEGWWNGYGGKVEQGESIEDAMVRELYEESGLTARSYRKRAIIEFVSAGSDNVLEMHVFEVTEYSGELVETEEMMPKWFSKQEIPFEQMWPSDREWLNMYFQGKNLIGNALYDDVSRAFLRYEFKEVDTV